MALPLMSAEVPKSSIEEYLMFFRHCNKCYPWFRPGYRPFEKELEDEEEIFQCYVDSGFALRQRQASQLSYGWRGLSTELLQVVQTGQVIGEEEDIEYEVLTEEKTSEATPSARKNKRKETTQAQDNPVQPKLPIESPSPPPTKMKSLIKGAAGERKVKEPVAAPTTTTETDEELILAEVIAKSIELAKKQQEAQGGELTHLELVLFDDMEAEN
ncbi:unnamed protein product, partial [Prunus brigantina]